MLKEESARHVVSGYLNWLSWIKRIAAACFLLFWERNGLLYANHGQPIISNEALASLTLFAAASKADEMETVRRLLISVLNRN